MAAYRGQPSFISLLHKKWLGLVRKNPCSKNLGAEMAVNLADVTEKITWEVINLDLHNIIIQIAWQHQTSWF